MRVSFIVATAGRTGELYRLLDSLAAQTHQDIEVVVVDQNPDDRLGCIGGPGAPQLKVTRLRCPPGLSSARNLGLRVASGDLIGFPDDDCRYPPTLIQQIVDLLARHPEWDGVTVPARDELGRPASGRWHTDSGWVTRANVWFRCVSFGMFLRAPLLRAVGPFDPYLGLGSSWGSGEELDFLLRALEAGARVWYEPRLHVLHPRRELGSRPPRQAYGYGRGIGRVLRKHRFSLWFALYMATRSLAGAALGVAAGEPRAATSSFTSALGRLVGYLWAGPAGSTPPASEVELFSLRLAALRTQEVIWHVAEAVRRGRRGYITTPNAHHLVLVQRDPAFRKACGDAWLRVPDGMPLVWASRLLGRPLPERVTGADLLPALCDVASRAGYSIFLLGGRQGVAERAASRLRARFPELTIAGIYSPVDGFGDDTGDQAAALEAVNRARPDILFVGLGAPVQEVWVHRHWDRLACTVAICCGAALDYAAGEKPRAPYWTRHAGLEWAWRLACEPGRLWRRYLASALTVGCLFVREWWKLRAVRASE